jgi:preprotein translocase subunit SecA
MNKQRQVIYEQRRNVLGGENLWSDAEDMLEEIVDGMLPEFADEKTHPEEWNLKGLDDALYKQFSVRFGFSKFPGDELTVDILKDKTIDGVKDLWRKKEEEFGKPAMDYLLKYIMLQSIDTQWKDHLLAMDHLREGIGLRGYGQKDPIREYQKEGYDMFTDMVERIKSDSIEKLCMVRVQKDEELEDQRRNTEDFIMSHGTAGATAETVKREGKKIGRNDPCSCGSGKKYKKCCGK